MMRVRTPYCVELSFGILECDMVAYGRPIDMEDADRLAAEIFEHITSARDERRLEHGWFAVGENDEDDFCVECYTRVG